MSSIFVPRRTILSFLVTAGTLILTKFFINEFGMLQGKSEGNNQTFEVEFTFHIVLLL